jgi:hypothetical protein
MHPESQPVIDAIIAEIERQEAAVLPFLPKRFAAQ